MSTKSILRSSVKEQVYEIIKEKILSGEIQPGARINMFSLVDELQVSNTPIREALSRLETEGLVIFVQNVGPKVVDLMPQLLTELNDTVSILLIGGYNLCCQHGITDALIKNMESKLEEQIETDKAGSEEEFINVSIEFDTCILKTLNNPLLYSFYQQIFNIFVLAVRYQNRNNPNGHKDSIDEHRTILSAVKSGDYNSVQQAISAHYMKEAMTQNIE